jgi:hypothetical protein
MRARLEPLPSTAIRTPSPAVPASGAAFRYAVHVPSGQRVRLLIDHFGSIMSATAEVEPDAIDTELGFQRHQVLRRLPRSRSESRRELA